MTPARHGPTITTSAFLTRQGKTLDGGYIAVGNVVKHEGSAARDWDILVSKIDGQGSIEWIKTIGRDQQDIASYVIQTRDGGYALVGITYPTGIFERDTFLVKLSSIGEVEWIRTYGGLGQEEGFVLIQDSNNDFVIGGWVTLSKQEFYGHYLFVMKLDKDGSVRWAKGFDSTKYPKNKLFGEETDQFVEYMGKGKDLRNASYDLIQTHDGGFAMTALKSVTSRVAALRTDSRGEVKWSMSKNVQKGWWGDNRVASDFYGLQIMESRDGNFAVAGNTRSPEGISSIFTWQFGDSPKTDSCMSELPVKTITLQFREKDAYFQSRPVLSKTFEDTTFTHTKIPIQK